MHRETRMFVKFSFCLFFQALTDEQLWRCILFFISYFCVIAEVVMSFFVDKPSAFPPNVSEPLFCWSWTYELWSADQGWNKKESRVKKKQSFATFFFCKKFLLVTIYGGNISNDFFQYLNWDFVIKKFFISINLLLFALKKAQLVTGSIFRQGTRRSCCWSRN